MRKTAAILSLAAAAPLALAALGLSAAPRTVNYLARSDFDEGPNARIRSDWYSITCNDGGSLSWDYIDNQDSCGGTTDVPAASYLAGVERTYFLAAGGRLNPYLPLARWMELQFEPMGDSQCPDLDTRLAPNPRPDVVPEPIPGCVDHLPVRFFAGGAFKSGATASTVYLLIEALGQRTGKRGQTTLEWQATYRLDFLNTLTIGPGPEGVTDAITLGDLQFDDFTAELWTLNNLQKDTLVGTFSMPLQATLQKTSQVRQ